MSGSTIKAQATLSKRVAFFFFRAAPEAAHHLGEDQARNVALAARLIPAGIGMVAFLAVLLTLDVAEDLPWSLDGPGLTFDEGFNVEVGVYLVNSFADAGLAVLHPGTLRDIYGHPFYNPDHPPLGRLVLGGTERILRATISDPHDQRPYVISFARVGVAAAFGVLVTLVTWFTSRGSDFLAGVFAGVSLLLTPRVFAHAHLASLETFTCLTYAGVVFMLAHRWTRITPLRWRDGLFPGLLLGLAFLTKIHAVCLPPVITLWAIWNWRFRALLPLIVLFTTAFVVFFLGWPWLWLDPVSHLMQYFARATERSIVYCFYLGERFADREVPWHYPFVMFIVTTPLPFLIVGAYGLIRPNRNASENREATRWGWSSPAGQLLLGAMLCPLFVFAIPGVTVYDGVRLFLMAWPLFAVWVGVGFSRITQTVVSRYGRAAGVLLLASGLLLPLGNLIYFHPCQLSSYGGLVGGLRSANALGFERTYWGDSVTPEFLRASSRQLPLGATLEVAPVLHPLQLEFMRTNSWLRHRPDVQLRAYDDRREDLSPYVLLIHRRADPWDSLTPPPRGTQVLERVEINGVPLAEFLKLP